ncbi:hypothetical protein N2152v2_000057 [Parachlorella kessleri]
MAGDKSSKPAKQSKAVVEDKQLKEDVKNFAAQLGLSGAGGAGFEGAFDDFKPELAQKKLGHRGDKGPDKPTKGPFKAPDKPADNHQERQQRKQQQPEQQKQQQQNGVRSSGGKAGTAGHGDRTYGSKQQQQQNGVAKPGQQQQQRQLSQGGHGKGGQPDKQDWQASVAAGQLCVKSILPRDEPAIWHEAAALLPTLPDGGGREAEPALVQAKKAAAEQLLQREEQAFEQSMGRRGEQDLRWLQQAKRSGTTQDKVAAMSVLVQESAVANLRSLDGLITMCAKTQGGRGVVGATMDALRELFTTVLLPDRKLRFFEQQPLGALGPGKEGERQLLYLLVEDAVKKKYAHFVDVLDACSRDNLDFVKDKAVKTMYELLSKKAEGEQRLLSSLVNKLGDPDRKLASKVGYLLTRLLAEHPGMKSVVVREIERFVFRPGLADRARYYCVVYLNQMVLGHRDSTGGAVLARRLVDLYFTLFKMTLDGKIGTAASLAKQKEEKAAERGKKGKKDGKKGGKKGGKGKAPAPTPAPAQPGELDARMLSALITGVRRAFPFVAPEDVEPLIEAHADALFKLIHTRSFGVATQALLLLFQLMTSRSSVSDRFYRAMYSALESPELTRSTKAPMFLSLLFKASEALQADVSHKRVSAFAKRILQVAQEAPANFACGCLLLVSELMKARPALWNAVLQPEDNERGEERFVDADVAVSDAGPGSGMAASDVKAVGASAAAGAEHESVPGVSRKHGRGKGKALVARIDVGGESDAQEEEAMLEESDSEGTSEAEEEDPQQQRQRQQQQQQQLLPRLQKLEAPNNPSGWPGSKEGYDMRKREPQFAGAERVCHWELASLAQHVHPSVAAMARTLLAGASVVYGGDPLRDLTLGAFLDKFVQKKAKAGERGGSLMQPLALQQQQQQGTAGTAARGQGVLSAAFAVLSERDVAPDTLFFHKYYSLAAVQSKLAGKKRKKAGDDMAELLSDESEEEDAIEDFLAGEEAGGDEGIGADPDRSTDFDYNDLAAAMDDEEDGGEGSSGAEEEPYSGIQESDSDAESLDGAQFSDLSGSEGEEEGDGTGSDSEGSPGLEDDDDESLAVSEDESSGGDTADEDAEVEALLTKQGLLRPGGKAAKKRKGSSARAESESDSLDSQVNPFELAEATDSEGEIEQQQEHQQKQRRRLQEGEKRLYGKDGEGAAARGKQKRARRERGAGAFGASAFASADDYAALIDRAEREEHAGGAGGEGGRQGKRRPGDTAGKRQRHG